MITTAHRLFVIGLLSLTLAGCGGSSDQSQSGSYAAGGSGRYFDSNLGAGPGANNGGPGPNNVGPGNGTAVPFGAGGEDGGTPPPAAVYDDFVYILNPPDGGGGNVAALGVDTNGGLSLIETEPDLSRPLVLRRSADGKFVYVLDYSTQTLRAYSVDAATGHLTALQDLENMVSANTLALTPDGHYAYVANDDSSSTATIAVYSVGSDGRLTQSGTPLPVPSSYDALTVSPDGHSLYGADGSALITRFAIDANSGQLEQEEDEPMDGSRPFNVVFNPSGSLAFVPYGSESYVSVYTVDTLSGQFTVAGRIPTQSSSYSVFVHPTLPVLYVSEYQGFIESFSYTESGETSAVGPAFDYPGLGGGLVLTQDGDFVYYANYFHDTIVSFSVGDNGALTQLDEYESADLENTLKSPRGGVSIPSARRVLDEDGEDSPGDGL
jgi:6-phosphogluconolactonase (cycloisomerase 2 family)